MKKFNESGRSMIEMLGVLAIIGVLSVGGITGYSKAMNKYKINKTNDQVSTLVANIRTLFASQTTYEGLDNANAIAFGIVPNDMYTAADAASGTLVNAYGGSVFIEASGALNEDDKRAFIITYTGLSPEACTTILTSDWGSDKSSGLLGIGGKSADTPPTAASILTSVLTTTDDGSSGNYAVPGGANNGTPIPITEAISMCGSQTNNNVVEWKYY